MYGGKISTVVDLLRTGGYPFFRAQSQLFA
jgi:hypothetical protein